MAIDQGTETLAVTTQERTWRVNIETPKGAVPEITVHRETVRTASDGTVISKEPCGAVQRSFLDLAPKSYTAGGITATGAQIAALIAAVADVERQTDLNKEKKNNV